jgi:hypothetical protein
MQRNFKQGVPKHIRND